MKRHRRWTIVATALALFVTLVAVSGQETTADSAEAAAAQDATTAPTARLLEELGRLMDEVKTLREELAASRLRAETASRELEELRLFIADHGEFGDDFERYQAMKAIAERDAKRREADEKRQRREDVRQARIARLQAARAKRDIDQAEEDRVGRYRDAGFASLGLDVFGSRMAYAYQTVGQNPSRVDYSPAIGLYYRPGGASTRVDYSRMTISGSILNASDEVRNLGVAVTFFDARGNQVGAETVQINNARPDVPYPFTSTIDMAQNAPFVSSSTYVLYADPV